MSATNLMLYKFM